MHQEALTKEGLKLFPKLKAFSDFYMAGGTALALQIGHRVSIDFDFFYPFDILKGLLGEVKKIFLKEKISPLINNADELTVLINGVKVTFLKYPFPIINKLVKNNGLKMLDIAELAATKAYTIGRRGSLKDYVDIFFIISGGFIGLDGIIELAEKKYGHEFNSRLFLEQLVYLNDVEEEKLLFLKKTVNKKQLENFFIKEVRKINFW
jgi:hypothetical protein